MKKILETVRNFFKGFLRKTLPKVIRESLVALTMFSSCIVVYYGVHAIFVAVLTALGVVLPLEGLPGILVLLAFLACYWQISMRLLMHDRVLNFFEWIRNGSSVKTRVYTLA